MFCALVEIELAILDGEGFPTAKHNQRVLGHERCLIILRRPLSQYAKHGKIINNVPMYRRQYATLAFNSSHSKRPSLISGIPSILLISASRICNKAYQNVGDVTLPRIHASGGALLSKKTAGRVRIYGIPTGETYQQL